MSRKSPQRLRIARRTEGEALQTVLGGIWPWRPVRLGLVFLVLVAASLGGPMGSAQSAPDAGPKTTMNVVADGAVIATASMTHADAVAAVWRYHRESKHTIRVELDKRTGRRRWVDKYAPAGGKIDWNAQPSLFRRFLSPSSRHHDGEGHALYTPLPLPSSVRAMRAERAGHSGGGGEMHTTESKHRTGPAAVRWELPTTTYEAALSTGTASPHKEPLTVASLSSFLYHSMGLSGLKRYRGSLKVHTMRVNPSSGNLHPTETYVLVDTRVLDVPPAGTGVVSGDAKKVKPRVGVYHYAPEPHGLELRAVMSAEASAALLASGMLGALGGAGTAAPAGFAVVFTTVYWRESWKYGLRAFRYCELDAGHALGAAAVSAGMHGWAARMPCDADGSYAIDDASLETVVGVDRADDFHPSERETVDMVITVDSGGRDGESDARREARDARASAGAAAGAGDSAARGAGAEAGDSRPFAGAAAAEEGTDTGKATIRTPPDASAVLWSCAAEASSWEWHGVSNVLSARGGHRRWKGIDAVVAAARVVPSRPRAAPGGGDAPADTTDALRPAGEDVPAPLPYDTADSSATASTIVRQRRSVHEMDSEAADALPRARFMAIMARLVVVRADAVGRVSKPWDVLPRAWGVNVLCIVLVHRVAGLEPGAYALLRDQSAEALREVAGDLDEADDGGCGSDLEWKLVTAESDAAAADSSLSTAAASVKGIGVPLYRLSKGDQTRFAQLSSCDQEIAGAGAFTVSIVSRFGPVLRAGAATPGLRGLGSGASAYRRLHWEAGLVGHMLYLEAEAMGVRGTGMGAFFDDSVLESLGLTEVDEPADGGGTGASSDLVLPRWQSLYHFTVGAPLVDTRVERALHPYVHNPGVEEG